jgi:hypothetical protein
MPRAGATSALRTASSTPRQERTGLEHLGDKNGLPPVLRCSSCPSIQYGPASSTTVGRDSGATLQPVQTPAQLAQHNPQLLSPIKLIIPKVSQHQRRNRPDPAQQRRSHPGLTRHNTSRPSALTYLLVWTTSRTPTAGLIMAFAMTSYILNFIDLWRCTL